MKDFTINALLENISALETENAKVAEMLTVYAAADPKDQAHFVVDIMKELVRRAQWKPPVDTPIMSLPRASTRNDQGVTWWRPVLKTLSVHGVPDDQNARHIVVQEDGEERYRFRLTREDAAHVARLLTGGAAA